MPTLIEYIERAKARQGFKSTNHLNFEMGFRGPTVFHWQKGRFLPDDESMIALAELAGMDPEAALLDLAVWRAEGKHQAPVAAAWRAIRKRATSAIIIALTTAGLATTGTNHAQGRIVSDLDISYATNNQTRWRWAWRWLRLWRLAVCRATVAVDARISHAISLSAWYFNLSSGAGRPAYLGKVR